MRRPYARLAIALGTAAAVVAAIAFAIDVSHQPEHSRFGGDATRLAALPSASARAVPPNWLAQGQGNEWTMQLGDPAGTRFSPLSEINVRNVASLKPAFTFDDGIKRGHEAAPLVVGGTMYVTTPYPNDVYALDLTKPDHPVKWHYQPKPEQAAQGVACCDVVNRGAVYGGGRLFFNTLDGNTIALDAASGREIWKTKLGEINRGETITMAPLLAEGRVLVGTSGGEMGVREAWDIASRHLLRRYASGSDPERFAVSPDGRTLVIANEDHAAVSFLDLRSGRITREVKVGPEPEGIGISPDGKLAVATSEAASRAHFIDTATGRLLDSVIVGNRPRDVLFLKGGREIWVSSEQRGTISVFDAATRKIIHVIDLVPAFPDLETVQAVEMEVTHDGKRAFVAMGRSNQAAEIDPATWKVVRHFPTGERNWGLALSPDDRRLYAVNGLSGDITIIDLGANSVLRRVKFDGKPWGVEALAR